MYNNLDRIYEKLIEQYNVVQTCTIDDELDLQDAIVENCVLYPENLNIDDMLPRSSIRTI